MGCPPSPPPPSCANYWTDVPLDGIYLLNFWQYLKPQWSKSEILYIYNKLYHTINYTSQDWTQLFHYIIWFFQLSWSILNVNWSPYRGLTLTFLTLILRPSEWRKAHAWKVSFEPLVVSLIKLTYLVNTPPPTQHYSFLKNLPHLFHSIIHNFWSVLFFSFIPFLFPFHFFFSFFSLFPSFTFPFFLWVTLLSYVRFFPRLNVPNKVFRNV